MSDAARIQHLLAHQPGLKAQQIAAELGLERSRVVAVLHSLPGSVVTQDTAYRWWPKAAAPASQDAPPAPRTLLAALCRYYLECLSSESGSGVSLAASDTTAWVPLDELPFAGRNPDLFAGRAARKLVQKARRERGQLSLYIGYAIRLRGMRLRGNQEELRLDPVLLYPVEEDAADPAAPLRPAG